MPDTPASTDDPTVERLRRRLADERDARRELEALLDRERQINRSDVATGLPTRPAVLEHLAAASARTAERDLAVFHVDVDCFGSIASVLGTQTADRVLWEVSRRIRAAVDGMDLVGRIGNDDFAVVRERISPEGAVRLAEEIRHEIERPVYTRGGLQVSPTVAIGARVAACSMDDPAELLDHARIACERAQAQGRGQVVVIDQSIYAEQNAATRLEARLDTAIEIRSMQLRFQPIVHPVSMRPIAYEALLRWEDPMEGEIPAAQFMPVAERTRQIVGIGDWALGEALRRIAALTTPRGTGPAVAVNVAHVQLHDPGFAANLSQHLARHRMPAQRLVLEVGESVLIDDDDVVAGNLRHLRRLGIRLAIDRVGTTPVPIPALVGLQGGILKVDRSLLRGIDTSAERRQVVGALIGMAHGLGLATVAVGVETDAELAVLRGLRIDTVQGSLTGGPGKLPTMEELMAGAAAAG